MNILLSPTCETPEGLSAVNFYEASVGFGKVSELHEKDERIGNIAVSFADLPNGPASLIFAQDPNLIKDEKRVSAMIGFSVGFFAIQLAKSVVQ